ncbi:MAG: carbamoyltransferase [Candidatus Omnitrophota bacterium]
MNILGISAFYHDSAACLIKDGEIAAAAQEERFTRKKHDASFPTHAIKACMKSAGVSKDQLDYVAFYDKPFVKFERILETYLSVAPAGFQSFLMAIPLWLQEKLWLPKVIKDSFDYEGPILFGDHHESHAASAFYPSPFQEAAFLTIDGVGEWSTTTYGWGRGSELKVLGETRFPHSLGLLYSAFTYYTGFKVNSGEYKVMGLAPYGEPKYVKTILDELLDLKEDGSFRMNMEYFNYLSGLTMTSENFDKLFGGPPRQPESLVTQKEMDLARSVQEVTEEIMMRMARHVHKETGMKNLCLAGGVALNCVANGKILREGPFESIWIQPAAGDAGGALGVALSVYHRYLNHPQPSKNGRDLMRAALLGPMHSDEEIRQFLDRHGYPYKEVTEEELAVRGAELLMNENVVGWFQGRMEFGPRALGSRSILGDARSPRMQSKMNLKIKFRESFRPFAPVVLREKVNDYFEMDVESPYMLLVAQVQKSRLIPMTEEQKKLFGIEKLNIPRSDIPAITHIDYSARVQTVAREDNPRYYDLIKAFEAKTGCAVLVNTSFNVRGEPIVCAPEDAYRCFMRTEMDYLIMGRCIIDKREQPAWANDADWRKEFALD